jgi:hypothetical protein
VGQMTVQTCSNETRLKCAVLADATGMQSSPDGLQVPFLAEVPETNSSYAENLWLFNRATTNAVLLQIRGANHSSPCDVGWMVQIPWGLGPARAADACYLWFFDTYLKGEVPPFPSNPETYIVQRK